MTWDVQFTKASAKQLRALPSKQQKLIIAWIDKYLVCAENPRVVPGTKKLEGHDDAWRWRIGDYRVLGLVYDDTIEIVLFRVGHRRDVYRNL